jgi:hypothetical protein
MAVVTMVVAVVAAAYGVFGRLQVTDFDFDGFLLHFSFPFLDCFVVSESHFWPFTEEMRKIGRKVTRKSDGPTVAQLSRHRHCGDRCEHNFSSAGTTKRFPSPQ